MESRAPHGSRLKTAEKRLDAGRPEYRARETGTRRWSARSERAPGHSGTDERFLAGAPRAKIAEAFETALPRRERQLRILNVGVALAALILLMPLFILIAIAIRRDSHGPVLYKQVRVGRDGRALGLEGGGRRGEDRGASVDATRDPAHERRERQDELGRRRENVGGNPFTIYKFRTMTMDAEDATGPVWASKEDHRVTRVGRWLRRYRLDELPQFWNVLLGDMSVVGPRPERPSFVHKLRREFAAYSLRQRVPPGITGLAQVHRGPDQTVDDVREKLNYDLEYCGRRSVLFDLIIMLRTLPAMLRRH